MLGLFAKGITSLLVVVAGVNAKLPERPEFSFAELLKVEASSRNAPNRQEILAEYGQGFFEHLKEKHGSKTASDILSALIVRVGNHVHDEDPDFEIIDDLQEAWLDRVGDETAQCEKNVLDIEKSSREWRLANEL